MMKVDGQLVHEVEQFLYREARLLDERNFDGWLEVFTEDLRYWVPVVSTRERGAQEVAGEDELAWLDDDKRTLSLRVKRLHTEFAYAEDPPSRTCRIISNIQVEPADKEDEVKVYSNFLIYKNRLETETDLYSGHREDVLRRLDGDWKIARRKLILAQNVLTSKNISIFL